jgi:hypothetical protein
MQAPIMLVMEESKPLNQRAASEVKFYRKVRKLSKFLDEELICCWRSGRIVACCKWWC